MSQSHLFAVADVERNSMLAAGTCGPRVRSCPFALAFVAICNYMESKFDELERRTVRPLLAIPNSIKSQNGVMCVSNEMSGLNSKL